MGSASRAGNMLATPTLIVMCGLLAPAVTSSMRTECQQAPPQLRGFGEIRPGQQDRKLFAAVTRDHLARAAHVGGQRIGYHAQTMIAGDVSVHIVESLELIHVDQQQGNGRVAANGTAPLLIEGIIKGATVGNPGERIDNRKQPQFGATVGEFGIQSVVLDEQHQQHEAHGCQSVGTSQIPAEIEPTRIEG